MSRRALLITATLLGMSQAALALDDPMRPPSASLSRGSTGTQDSGYALSSTFIARDRRSAIINGRQVAIGDRINGARVIEILPTHVKLQAQSGTITVQLLPLAVKKPARVE